MFQEYPKFISTGIDEKGVNHGVIVFSKDEELKVKTPAEKPKANRKKERG